MDGVQTFAAAGISFRARTSCTVANLLSTSRCIVNTAGSTSVLRLLRGIDEVFGVLVGRGMRGLLVLSVSGEELDHRAADRLLSPRERERAKLNDTDSGVARSRLGSLLGLHARIRH